MSLFSEASIPFKAFPISELSPSRLGVAEGSELWGGVGSVIVSEMRLDSFFFFNLSQNSMSKQISTLLSST